MYVMYAYVCLSLIYCVFVNCTFVQHVSLTLRRASSSFKHKLSMRSFVHVDRSRSNCKYNLSLRICLVPLITIEGRRSCIIIYVCVHVSMYVCVCVCVYICVFVCVCECVYVCVHVHVYNYIYVFVFVCVCTCIFCTFGLKCRGAIS